MGAGRLLRRVLGTAIFTLIAIGCGSNSIEQASSRSTTTTAGAAPTETASGETSPPPVTAASTSSTSSTTMPDPVECAITGSGAHLVDVRIDDADGGLNLRRGPGLELEIVTALPRGTEVLPSGQCMLDGASTPWWEIVVATDPTLGGWVSAQYLIEREPVRCPIGSAAFDGLERVSVSGGDFDGDGELDQLYIGNRTDTDGIRIQVEFASGQYASADVEDIMEYGEVLGVLRPVGAPHDVVIFRDVYGSGASTNLWVLAEVIDCAPRTFGEFLEGGSVGWGSVGHCFEPTPFGVRIWFHGAVGATVEEREANRVDSAWLYDDSDLVEVAGEPPEDRECAPDWRFRRTTYFGTPDEPTDLVGGTADTLDDLADAIVDLYDAESWTMIGDPIGIDAQGGVFTIDVVGLEDDSIGGARLEIDFTTLRTPDGDVIGQSITHVRRTPLCSRGVTGEGLCV